jgi:hypothetical protein
MQAMMIEAETACATLSAFGRRSDGQQPGESQRTKGWTIVPALFLVVGCNQINRCCMVQIDELSRFKAYLVALGFGFQDQIDPQSAIRDAVHIQTTTRVSDRKCLLTDSRTLTPSEAGFATPVR